MEISEEYRKELISKYRSPLFTAKISKIQEIDDLVKDDNDLKAIIQINNEEMRELINEIPIRKEEIMPLFKANVNFYRLAEYREVSVPGKSFIITVATAIDYEYSRVLKFFNDDYYEAGISK